MKTKKTVITALAVTLLITAALIVGCNDQFEGIPVKKDGGNHPVPAGKGIVRFKFKEDGKALTIMPDSSSSGREVTTMFFDVKFTETGGPTVSWFPDTQSGGAAKPTTKATYSEITAPIPLDPGTYAYEITAYSTKTGTEVPIALYTSTANIVLAAAGSTVGVPAINLIGITTGTDDGFFTYDITVPADTYATKNLVITDTSDNLIDTITLNTGSNNNSAAPYAIAPGYYKVKVILAKAKHLSYEFVDVLHIYPDMTSKMPAISPSQLVQNQFEVSFDLNEGGLTLASGTAGEDYSTSGDGVTQTIYYANKAAVPSSEPEVTDDHYVFKGWYDSSSANVSDPKFDFTATRIFADTPLYAIWAQEQGFNISLAAGDKMYTLTSTGNTISKGTYNGNNTVKLTVEDPIDSGAWDANSFVWYVNGIVIANTTNELIITNADDTDYFKAGIFSATEFTVSVTALKGGVMYSTNVEITVTN